MGSFDNQVVLITGAASGIGAATARRFAREGATLMLGDVNQDGLAALATSLGAEGGRVAVQATDVTDQAQVDALTQAAVDRFGRLDIVFNNAGTGIYGKTPDLDPSAWHAIIAVDLHSVFYGCRAAIPHLRRAGGGAIVNTASVVSTVGFAGFSPYTSSKHAVLGLTRNAGLEYFKQGIRINAVLPGPIETPMAEIGFGGLDNLRGALVDGPAGRPGTPEEIAKPVLFLLSNAASYISGQGLTIDGGYTLQ